MNNPLSVQQLFESYGSQLQLTQLVSSSRDPVIIDPSNETLAGISMVGFLNLVRPHRVQVLGEEEIRYLGGLGDNALGDNLQQLASLQPAMIVVVDQCEIPAFIRELAEEKQVPLFSSTLDGETLIEYLHHYLARLTSDTAIIHGVCMDVLGIGVLLTGPSGIGKSELALELLNRGHRLVADDAPEFRRLGPNNIRGYCPPLLADFIEVRGLGILNVRAMFGDNALIHYKRLRLIINLQKMTDEAMNKLDRIGTMHHFRQILGVDMPEVVIPIAPGRNIAVIVEAAVRNHLLVMNGYRAADDFIKRQKEFIKNTTQ